MASMRCASVSWGVQMCTWLVHNPLQLVVKVISSFGQSVWPPVPQSAQVFFLVAVETFLQPRPRTHAADRHVTHRLTDDWQGARVVHRPYADQDTPWVTLATCMWAFHILRLYNILLMDRKLDKSFSIDMTHSTLQLQVSMLPDSFVNICELICSIFSEVQKVRHVSTTNFKTPEGHPRSQI